MNKYYFSDEILLGEEEGKEYYISKKELKNYIQEHKFGDFLPLDESMIGDE